VDIRKNDFAEMFMFAEIFVFEGCLALSASPENKLTDDTDIAEQ
jgi:hypothetical protein